MDEVHTPAGYFIAIFAVLGAAWLMPPLPILILISPFLLLVGIITTTLYSAMQRRRKLKWTTYLRLSRR